MKSHFIIIMLAAIFVSSIFFTFSVIQSQDLNPSPGKLAPGTGVWKVEHAKCSNGEVRTFIPPRCEGGPCTTRLPKEREPKPKGPVGPTPTPAPTPTPIANARWTPVLGYTNSFNTCSDLCKAFQQNNCNLQAAIQYCSAVVSLDLNKNGKIDSSETGSSPAGTTNCETNARCYDVIDNCTCTNLQLNIGTCISLFYQVYIGNGMTAIQSLQTIAQQIAGNCRPPGT
jgi:uncharacterized membrane protein